MQTNVEPSIDIEGSLILMQLEIVSEKAAVGNKPVSPTADIWTGLGKN